MQATKVTGSLAFDEGCFETGTLGRSPQWSNVEIASFLAGTRSLMFGHAKPCGPTSEKEASMSSPTFRHIARLSRPTTRVLHADRLEHGRVVLAYWRRTAGMALSRRPWGLRAPDWAA